MCLDQKTFEENLKDDGYTHGERRHKWRLVEKSWPECIFEVKAKCGKWWGLKINLQGYPEVPPEGTMWHCSENRQLGRNEMPVLSEQEETFTKFYPRLYCPFDRYGLIRHQEWITEYPQSAWTKEKTISFYLGGIHDLLNSKRYCPPENA